MLILSNFAVLESNVKSYVCNLKWGKLHFFIDLDVSFSVHFVYLAKRNKSDISKNLLMHPFGLKLSSVIYLPKMNIIEKKLQI